MVMIIDACHSAGSVEHEGFKPGPMGSRGLGQLAYNKRMRILAVYVLREMRDVIESHRAQMQDEEDDD